MFEHSLIGLEAKKPFRRAWFSLPTAVGLHLVAVAAFTFASAWNVEAVPEPMILEPFVVQVELPPPPPPILGSGRPATETKAEVKAEVKPPAPEQPIQPTETADLSQVVKTDSSVVDAVAGLPPGGDPRGSIYGVEHGDPNFGVDFSEGPVGPSVDSVLPTPAEPETSEPIQVGGAVTRPVVVSRVEPRYTELARKARIEGVVIVKAVIDERGYVTNVELVRGQPMGLDKSAMDAVRQWRFTPATLHGAPVKVYYNLTVTFSLQR